MKCTAIAERLNNYLSHDRHSHRLNLLEFSIQNNPTRAQPAGCFGLFTPRITWVQSLQGPTHTNLPPPTTSPTSTTTPSPDKRPHHCFARLRTRSLGARSSLYDPGERGEIRGEGEPVCHKPGKGLLTCNLLAMQLLGRGCGSGEFS